MNFDALCMRFLKILVLAHVTVFEQIFKGVYASVPTMLR